jgi:hypothetical protein
MEVMMVLLVNGRIINISANGVGIPGSGVLVTGPNPLPAFLNLLMQFYVGMRIYFHSWIY